MRKFPLSINDRIDIAMAVGAAEVHIGQSDMPAGIARKVIGKDMLLGVSAVIAQKDIKGAGAALKSLFLTIKSR